MRSSCRPGWARAVLRSFASALLAAFALAGANAAAATHTITIDGMSFEPASLQLRRGDTVRWVNKDLVPHTATAPKDFDSGTLAPGQSWEVQVDRPGRHEYVCRLHPTMKAVLVVE
jgi:plastocyanin